MRSCSWTGTYSSTNRNTESGARPWEEYVGKTRHVFDDFRLDLLLRQVQFEDGVLPDEQQSLQVELGQFQKVALGCTRAAGDQHMQVRHRNL